MRGLIFIFFSFVSCELQLFPTLKYEGAKDGIEHPRYREQLSWMFPHLVNETKNDSRQGRIINGELAALGQFPFQVLMYMTSDGNSWYTCGGALVKKNFILTAAHCIEAYNRFDIYVGLVERPPGFYVWGTIITGRNNIIPHPERNSSEFSYDVGLLRIEDAPSGLLDSQFVGVVNLPTTAHMDVSLVDKIGTFSGFGRTSNNVASLSPVLLYAEAPIMENSNCALYFGPFVRGNNLCINTVTKATSSCGGDSGGPLTVADTLGEGAVLAGIVSFGSAYSCTSGYPSVFARVTHFVEWINSIIEPVTPPSGGNCNCICNCFTCPAPPADPTTTTISSTTQDDFWRK